MMHNKKLSFILACTMLLHSTSAFAFDFLYIGYATKCVWNKLPSLPKFSSEKNEGLNPAQKKTSWIPDWFSGWWLTKTEAKEAFKNHSKEMNKDWDNINHKAEEKFQEEMINIREGFQKEKTKLKDQYYRQIHKTVMLDLKLHFLKRNVEKGSVMIEDIGHNVKLMNDTANTDTENLYNNTKQTQQLVKITEREHAQTNKHCKILKERIVEKDQEIDQLKTIIQQDATTIGLLKNAVLRRDFNAQHKSSFTDGKPLSLCDK